MADTATELLRPDAASAYLAARWAIRASTKTLAKYRVQGAGAGPRYRTAGRDVIYARTSLDAWAEGRLSKTDFGSTAESRQATAA